MPAASGVKAVAVTGRLHARPTAAEFYAKMDVPTST